MEFKKRKIGRILRLLSKQDVRNFKLFLDSPYFVKEDQSKTMHALFDCLINGAKNSNDSELSEKYIYSQVFGKEEIVQGKIDKLIAALNQYLIQFLGIENQKQPNKNHLAALEILRKRDGIGLWKNIYNKIQKDFKKEKGTVVIPSLEFLQLELEKFEFQNLDPLKTSKESFSDILNALDRFYINYLLDIAIQVLATNKFIIPVELESRFEALKLLLSKKNSATEHPEFAVKHRAFVLLSNPGSITKHEITALLELQQKHDKHLNPNTTNNIRSIARNLAIDLYNFGQKDLEKFIFDLYREDVDKERVYYYSKIPGASVNNIVTFALRQKQFKWLETFLENQRDRILEEYMADFIISLNQAKLLFFQGKFMEVLNHLQFDVKDFHLKSNARILEVMTYYELKSEQLHYKIEAYKIFIYRMPKAKVSSKFLSGHNNFIDLLKNINHPKTIYDTKRIEKIKSKIISTEVLAEKSWLLEKIEELKIMVQT